MKDYIYGLRFFEAVLYGVMILGGVCGSLYRGSGWGVAATVYLAAMAIPEFKAAIKYIKEYNGR